MTNEEAVHSAGVVQLISRLAASVRDIEDRTADISAAAQQTFSAIESVADRSVQTSLMASKLNSIVAQFRLLKKESAKNRRLFFYSADAASVSIGLALFTSIA